MVCPLLRVIIACFLQSYGCFCVWLVCCGNLLISRIARHFIPSVQSFAIKKGSAFWANVSQQVDVMTANLACSFSFAMWLMYCVFLFVKVNGASALRASIRVSLLFTLINLWCLLSTTLPSLTFDLIYEKQNVRKTECIDNPVWSCEVNYHFDYAVNKASTRNSMRQLGQLSMINKGLYKCNHLKSTTHAQTD